MARAAEASPSVDGSGCCCCCQYHGTTTHGDKGGWRTRTCWVERALRRSLFRHGEKLKITSDAFAGGKIQLVMTNMEVRAVDNMFCHFTGRGVLAGLFGAAAAAAAA